MSLSTLARPTRNGGPHSGAYSAVVARDVAAVGDPLMVTIPAFDGGRHVFGPVRFSPRIGPEGGVVLPRRGDGALVMLDETGRAWLAVLDAERAGEGGGGGGGPALSDANPLPLGPAAPGTGSAASRADHVHPTTGLVLEGDARLSDERTPLDLSVTDAKVAAGAAIAKAKLAPLAITDADVAAAAGIAKSKLAALTITNADVAAGAAIAESKLALASDAVAGTPSRRTLGTGALQAAPGDHTHASLPWGTLGYGQRTADQTGISGETDLTNLWAVASVGAGRRVRVSAQIWASRTSADNRVLLRIRESTTQHQAAAMWMGSGSASMRIEVVLTPTQGSHTYRLTLAILGGSGTASLVANAETPAFILVEDLGPA